MKHINLLLTLILFLGTLFHIGFLHLNEVLKVADSFAYLQMAYFLWELSPNGLGTGWFGFLYSLPIALIDTLVWNDFQSAQIVNLILLNISAVLVWMIARKILSESSAYLVVILFFLSPTLLHFHLHILSENIYIPLFLLLFLLVWNFVETLSEKNTLMKGRDMMLIAFVLALMYFTRAEAFIYILSLCTLWVILLIQKKISWIQMFCLWILFCITFFLCIFPYLFHLHSLSGEWSLTNKWASNLRQAELRGVEKMDDAGFERAVAELTPDNTQLIAGFAGGMSYTEPQIDMSLREMFWKNPEKFIGRIFINQKKLYTHNLPEIFLWKSVKLFSSDDARFANIFFLICLCIPLVIVLWWAITLYQKQRNFVMIFLCFFLLASLFFTLFFTLNRYFLIFFPGMLIFFVHGAHILPKISGKKILTYTSIAWYIWLCLLSVSVYSKTESPKDDFYALKKEAGMWLNNTIQQGEWLSFRHDNLRIMERFPVVTYYAGSRERFITPYTDDIQDVYEYGRFNDIDFLVVDTMDFQRYRPDLIHALENTPENFENVREFHGLMWEKVILYRLRK